MKLISEGKAPRLPQPEEGATYEGIQRKETARVSANRPGICTLPGSSLGRAGAPGRRAGGGDFRLLGAAPVGEPRGAQGWVPDRG